MKWTRGKRSANLEDRRGQRAGRGGFPLPRGRGGRMSLGTLLLLFVLSVVFKQDFFSLMSGLSGGGGMSTQAPPSRSTGPVTASPEEETMVDFMSFLLDDNQKVWAKIFPSLGQRYDEARLVLFRDAVSSACGFAQSATGPFYCPGDQKVYLDLSFFRELGRRFGAPGDFAQAYVVAHEIAHHVQQELGIERQMRLQQRQRPDLKNKLSVRLELQADCLAGVWAHSAAQRGLLEPGDVQEGLGAAAAVGDDRIQKSAGRYVNPESFTHGSSAQRMRWFQTGFKSGDPNTCDTFSASAL